MIALILARGGSKQVPKKNLKILGDKPMILHIIEKANSSQKISKIFVSSDCDEILEVSTKAGAIPIKRPIELASDLSKDIDSFIHALDFIGDVEEIIHLRVTTPLIETSVLDSAINFYLQNKELCTSMRSVHETPDSVLKFFVKDGLFLKSICETQNNVEIYSLPRQSLPSTYCPNGYIDIVKIETFKNGHNFYGNKILSYETKFTPEVDTIDDFYYIEYLYNKKNNI